MVKRRSGPLPLRRAYPLHAIAQAQGLPDSPFPSHCVPPSGDGLQGRIKNGTVQQHNPVDGIPVGRMREGCADLQHKADPPQPLHVREGIGTDIGPHADRAVSEAFNGSGSGNGNQRENHAILDGRRGAVIAQDAKKFLPHSLPPWSEV